MNKVFSFFNKFLVLWVILFGILAYLIPATFLVFEHIFSLFFGLAMFGIGLTLTTDDYKKIIKSPYAIAFGTLCQFTIMPALAFLTGHLFRLPKEYIVGLVLTGAAPGAMTSNVISYLSKADVAFSISLTALSTLLCPVLTPLITKLLVGQQVPFEFLKMFLTIIYIVIIPLFLGFIIRLNFPKFVKSVGELPSTISVIAIVIITSYVVARNQSNLELATFVIIMAVIFHNLSGMILGFLSGYVAKFNFIRRKTLSIEIGMQNAGLGVVLAIKHFGATFAVPAAIFTIWCIISAALLIRFWNIFERK